MNRIRFFVIAVLLGRIVTFLPMCLLLLGMSVLSAVVQWCREELPEVLYCCGRHFSGPLEIWRRIHDPAFPYRKLMLAAADRDTWPNILRSVVVAWFGRTI